MIYCDSCSLLLFVDQRMIIFCSVVGAFIGLLAMALTVWGIKRRLQAARDQQNHVEMCVVAEKNAEYLIQLSSRTLNSNWQFVFLREEHLEIDSM